MSVRRWRPRSSRSWINRLPYWLTCHDHRQPDAMRGIGAELVEAGHVSIEYGSNWGDVAPTGFQESRSRFGIWTRRAGRPGSDSGVSESWAA
jgi:hypothetical protein